MLRVSQGLSLSLIASALVVIAGCGKKKSSSQNNEGSGQSSGIVLSGQLAITQSLTGSAREMASRGVIRFQVTKSGDVMGMEELNVNDRGEFSTTLVRENEMAEKIKTCIVNDQVDRSCAKNVFPEKAQDIDSASDADLNKGVKEMLNNKRQDSAFRYVLVSFVKSGNARDEASSMQFIGMPTNGADDLRVIPADAAKGDINLGEITGSGDEAKAKTSANDKFYMSETALRDMANASQVLKILKNAWINRATKPAQITPWFGYMSNKFAEAENTFSAPSDLTYMGGGYYISVKNLGVSMNEVCPETGEVAAKTIFWNPPSPVTLKGGATTTSFSSAKQGSYRRSSQYNELMCGHDGLYTRARSYASNEFMMQIGQNFVGNAPAGYWELKVGDELKGSWDLSAAKPYDTNPNKPTIFVPAFKVSVQNGKATKVEAKFYSMDHATGTYREITDVSGLKTLVHSMGFDLRYVDSGRQEQHLQGQFDASGIAYIDISSDAQARYNCTDNDCLGGIGLSYYIGPVSYRMELRRDMW